MTNKRTTWALCSCGNAQAYTTLELCIQCYAKSRYKKKGYNYNMDVVKLRNEGLTFEQIGKQLNISRQAAHQSYHNYMSAHNTDINADIIN